jgi:Na+-driven multidrug efflux pump
VVFIVWLVYFRSFICLQMKKSNDFATLGAGIGNLVNVILDAILVFPLGLGVRGAALATVTSEYVYSIIGYFFLLGLF